MAYSDPGDAVGGLVITAAWGDAVRADVVESALARVTAAGDLVVATAANVLARLPWVANGSVLTAAGGTAAWQIQPAAYVTKTGVTAFGLGAWTAIDFDAETADTDAMHAAAPNPSRLTIPVGGDGWYTFGFFGNAARVAATGSWSIRILLDNATVLAQTKVSEAAGVPAFVTLTSGYVFAAGNYIEAQYYTDDGAITMVANPAFWAIWQRP